MTTSPASAGVGRKIRLTSVLLGVGVGLLADAVAVAGLPQLQVAWSGVGPSSSGSLPPVWLPGGPSSAQPSGKRTPVKLPSSGEIKVTDDIKRGVVLVDGVLDSATTSSGTGMVLTADGQVLTNYHVVRSTTSITVTIAEGNRTFAATVIGRDATKDVALLQLKGASGLSTITADPDPVHLGDGVVAAGNAGGQGYLTAFAGKITAQSQNIRVKGASASDPEENLSGLYATDAHARPGDSGGPLFDAQFEVLGMTTAGSETGKGAAYAVPIANAMTVVGLIRDGKEGDGVVVGPKPSIGINASEDGLRGVKVTKVISGTPAQKAGLRAGDHLKSLDGNVVSTLQSLMGTLDHFQPGQKITVEWVSNGVIKTADVVLDKSKYN